MEKPTYNSTHSKKAIQPLHYLSRAEATAIEKELLEEFKFGHQQLIEIWGHASAMAVTKVFPKQSLSKKQPTLLVICGCEQNGAIGLACARHLRVFEYEPTIFYPKKSSNPLYRDFTTQCEKIDIPFLSYLPAEVKAVQESGWDVEMGSSDGISPDVLVSLAAPKQCATRFMGKHHLVAGRFLPYDVQKKFELNLPEYPGTECVVSL
ncbi:PREDICTED: yjeF N-terminal domain-containing protein 3 [Thamnophis sirtalis]|uniref:YjeF N-terminal domain-containing protein 3 n=1 Tax=Thamnophis sirtalis TaxID=35019 RepID=A0A6I9YFR0_9SAUR|nr:PREDICTED: yjeF N-terminal domain-containing protein 3 [Thamnophis sirtalis]